MAWSPQMQKWMQDAPSHGKPVRLFTGYGRVRRPTPVPNESLLTQGLTPMLSEDKVNILLTDAQLNTQGLDPLTDEHGNTLII